MGLLARLRQGLTRTTQQVVQRFDEIVRRSDAGISGDAAADDDTLDALEELLISADVGVAATGRILGAVRAKSPHGEGLRALVKQEIRSILEATGGDGPATGGRAAASEPIPGPRVALIVGVNGTGKTTTVGKLANLYAAAGQRPLICAADTFRAAAVEQLADLGGPRGGGHHPGARRRRSRGGRLRCHRGCTGPIAHAGDRRHRRPSPHARRISCTSWRRSGESPRARCPAPRTTCCSCSTPPSARTAWRRRGSSWATAGVNGIVLAKLDGTAKGGIAVAIAHDLKLPIRYVGVGEAIDDLLPFSASDYVDALFEPKW